MKIYGWQDLSEACYGIQIKEVDSERVETQKDGELMVNDLEGWWFSKFSLAKNSYIKVIKYMISWQKDALKDARKLRKSELIEK